MPAFCRRPSSIARAAVVLALALLWPICALAQRPSLAEVARKEQARRKAVQGSEKTLTNKDLPPSALQPVPAPQPPDAPPAAQPAPPAQPPAEAAKPAEEEKDEAWWRTRVTRAREAVQRNEMFLAALQSRVNALSTDFVNRDDPYQRAKIGEDRQKALVEMDRVRAEIAQGKQAIEDIEEEARKAGVPPGWLR